jgi:hypothetical protein
MKLRWDEAGVEKSPARVGGGAEMRCLLAESSSSFAAKQMRERGRWFPMCGQEKGPTEAGPKLACSRKGALRTNANAERVRLVPERKAPPKRGKDILEGNQDEDTAATNTRIAAVFGLRSALRA